MNGVIRDAFIRIHQEDVIGRLKSEFDARYRGCIYRAKIEGGTEVSRMIAAHRKQARLNNKGELLQERRRQQLLNSSNPKEVKQGMAMVTPASIFEQMATPDMVESEFDADELRESAGAEDDDADAATHMNPDHDGDFESAADPASADLTPQQAKELNGMENFGSSLGALHGTNYFVIEMGRAERRQKPKATPRLELWLPLRFPDIPKKGDFDVEKLRGSKYFFS